MLRVRLHARRAREVKAVFLLTASSLCCSLLLRAAGLDSVAERTERARRALALKREKRRAVCVRGIAALAAARKRSRAATAAMLQHAFPVEIMQHVCMMSGDARTRIRTSILMSKVCMVWRDALRGEFMPHALIVSAWECVVKHERSVCMLGRTCWYMRVHTQVARARADVRHEAYAVRQRVRAVEAVWMGARVRVPWPADGAHVAYAGTVIGVRCGGVALRVRFDGGVGASGLKCHTLEVHICERQ